YQGCDVWDLSLVDPDNRRLVDYETRRALLNDVRSLDAIAVMARSDEGAPKLFLIARALELRARRPEVFGPHGGYEALWATGPRADHVIAFCRGGDVIAIAPRWPLALDGWRGTTFRFPDGLWRNVLTEESHQDDASMNDVVAGFPVALLERV
ncbi:MAG: malto-oligosyltrehalose synthase, partial [Actinomycetota bacterium]|nr:malto-oligosyltrehalose synthase [Actinomycetota bacterium]